ncbi:MAG: class I SAM-dependent methyltransferase [Candidatus Omnitrophota bacterium]|jgi:ubiquinone/menaquinone biosynthesis C-methylase UbiE
MGIQKETEKTYGLLWNRSLESPPQDKWHYNAMQAVIDVPIVRGELGIEVGSGCGYDTYLMARSNPLVKLVSIDISDGIFKTKELVSGLGNVLPVKCSALEISAKDESFDFAYSFGVLHHTSDPGKGLSEMARVLKKGAPAFVYLYEDHSENIAKYLCLKLVSIFRLVTSRLPKKFLFFLSWAASPVVFVLFTLPSRLLRKFDATKKIAENMPFNFGGGPFSLQGDLYDRFGAPVERRFSRQEMYDMFGKYGFDKVNVTRLKDTAGWVAWGYKANA